MNHYIAVHFETCGMPNSASPVVLDALLFDADGVALDRFCLVMKPPDHSNWDQSADAVHGVTQAVAQSDGYPYSEATRLFNGWINNMDFDVTLVFWDKDTTVTLSTMVKGTVDVFNFLGNKKLPINKALDMQMVMSFYMHRTKTIEARNIQFHAPVTQVAEAWGIGVDESQWSYVQGNYTFRSRAMAFRIHLVFMALFNAKGN